MQINLLAVLSGHSPGPRSYRATASSIDAVAILGHPSTHRLELIDKVGLDFTGRQRSYIEQEICIMPGCSDQIVEQLFFALKRSIALVISPRLVDGFASFQRE